MIVAGMDYAIAGRAARLVALTAKMADTINDMPAGSHFAVGFEDGPHFNIRLQRAHAATMESAGAPAGDPRRQAAATPAAGDQPASKVPGSWRRSRKRVRREVA